MLSREQIDEFFKLEGVIQNAYVASANVSGVMSEPNASEWPLCGLQRADNALPWDLAGSARILATFSRENRDAPPEALYRHSCAHVCSALKRDGWLAIEPHFRAAYSIFHKTLPILDDIAREERERAEAAQPKPPRPEIVAANETTLEQHGRFDETVLEKPETINLGDPFKSITAPPLAPGDAERLSVPSKFDPTQNPDAETVITERANDFLATMAVDLPEAATEAGAIAFARDHMTMALGDYAAGDLVEEEWSWSASFAPDPGRWTVYAEAKKKPGEPADPPEEVASVGEVMLVGDSEQISAVVDIHYAGHLSREKALDHVRDNLVSKMEAEAATSNRILTRGIAFSADYDVHQRKWTIEAAAPWAPDASPATKPAPAKDKRKQK